MINSVFWVSVIGVCCFCIGYFYPFWRANLKDMKLIEVPRR